MGRNLIVIVFLFMTIQIAKGNEDLYTKQYSICMDKSEGITLNIMNCINAEIDIQDMKLNDSFKKLRAQLAPKRKKQLLATQRLWIQYRDANCDFYADPDGGTMASIISNNCFLNETTSRAEELYSNIESETDLVDEKGSIKGSEYYRASECYKNNDNSKSCKVAYESLIKTERRSIKDEDINKYKEKSCSGLTMDDLLCTVAKEIGRQIDREAEVRRSARFEHYLANRSDLQKKYNECGVAYYEKAGLKRDGKWIGAYGISQLSEAEKSFNNEFNWDCKIAGDAANRLNIEYAHYFVKTL